MLPKQAIELVLHEYLLMSDSELERKRPSLKKGKVSGVSSVFPSPRCSVRNRDQAVLQKRTRTQTHVLLLNGLAVYFYKRYATKPEGRTWM